MAAIDGDTDINKAIWFELEFLPGQDCKFYWSNWFGYVFLINGNISYLCLDSDLISIDKISGDIEVKAIDRDELNQEVFPFSVSSQTFLFTFGNNTNFNIFKDTLHKVRDAYIIILHY